MTDVGTYVTNLHAKVVEIWGELEDLHTSLIELKAIQGSLAGENQADQIAVENGLSAKLLKTGTVWQQVRECFGVIIADSGGADHVSSAGLTVKDWDAEFDPPY